MAPPSEIISELAKVKAKRIPIRRNVTIYIKKIENNLAAEEIDLIELEENLELIKQKEIELKNLDDKIESLIQDASELETEIESICEYQEKICLWKVRAEKKINKTKTNVPKLVKESSSSDNYSILENIKLPKLSLPIFSGNIIDWITFKDLFNASVNNNPSLSNAQKLQYLKSSLKGDALRIIQSIPISDDNFKIAFNLLNERYSNQKEQIFAHIKRFLSLPNIYNESSTSLLNLVDNINEIIRSLEVLGQKVDNFSDTLMLYLVLQKLDSSTKLWWERQLTKKEIPKLNELIEFLKTYARTLENSKSVSNRIQKPLHPPKINSFVSTSVCAFCKQNHCLSKCSKFLNLSVHKRCEFVKLNHLCFNCLSNLHLIKKCKSSNTCNYCSKRHHSSLHIVSEENRNNPNPISLSPNACEFIPNMSEKKNENPRPADATVCANYSNSRGKGIKNKKCSSMLLCTAIVKVRNASNELVTCRCLLDSGSEKSFIRQEVVNSLGLKVNDANISVFCLGNVGTVSTGEVDLLFSPHFNDSVKFSTSAFIIESICGKIPNATLSPELYDKFQDLILADPSFYKPGDIDILLGVNVFFTLLKGEIMKRDDNLPFAVSSKLGWIIAGATTFSSSESPNELVNNFNISTDELVKSFWELEQVPSFPLVTNEEKLCEKHFVDNFSRSEDGRYSVKLPFKPDREILGNSKVLAFKKFLGLEKRLLGNPNVYEQYKDFMSEYLALGHMEETPYDNTINDNEHYFIPHHHVINESSPTTKLRVVFNASSKTSSGFSLNDTLMNGPKVQDDLFAILLRFRCYNIAITSDIQKMYRQIEIHNEDRDFQRILWRDDPLKPIKEYRLCTVTYGTTSASYLATRVLKQLAIDEELKHPKAADLVLHNFYVDDMLMGAETREEAIELISELCALLRKGKFTLHKWCSNDQGVLDQLNESKSVSSTCNIVDSKTIKVLGLKWEPSQDKFVYSVPFCEDENEQPTKRSILSSVSKIFDPLGWLAPLVITAKILIQDIWKFQLSWDDPVPQEIRKRWFLFKDDISRIESVSVPRKVLLPKASNVELYCFCDASEKAYASVIYLRSANASGIHVSLLTSKTRVAPLRTISIPRLELCSAVLLVHLLQIVRTSLKVPIDAIHAFTDSTIVLSWLTCEPTRWQIFVANRVAEIQSVLPIQHWNHVSSSDNPADCATRGLLSSDLVNFDLWWSGPCWLRRSDIQFSKDTPFSEDALNEERKKACCLVETISTDLPIIYNSSSYGKLKRVAAWCLRFIKNAKSPNNRLVGFLTSEELKHARNVIVKIIQKQEFPNEYKLLEKKLPLSSSSKILSLNPFLDDSGLIRVGGRLANAEISNDSKHPIILPKNNHLTRIIITHYHENFLHAGISLLIAVIRREFWIIHAKSVLKEIIWKCVKCHRLRAKTAIQIMSNLPSPRVIPSRVFSKTGLDYAGPFLIRPRSGRGVKAVKCYLCIFVCFSTKAVHIEIAGNLSSESFIAALKRFVARRGKPNDIFSDCGTNFVAANKELKKIVKRLHKEESIHNFLSNEDIKWHFNPPSAPHFGGIWEAAVKSAKSHLKRTIGEHKLTQEEFLTLVAQVESCLNSRPLCPLSDDPSELAPLTPGHFLIGTSLATLPEENLLSQKVPLLHRWKLTQQIFQSFWKRWSLEYLSNLQQRPKWRKVNPDIKVNDLVIIKEDNMPPLKWKLGRVLEVFPGLDQRVRVVTLKTATGTFKRPIHKLSVLPIND